MSHINIVSFARRSLWIALAACIMMISARGAEAHTEGKMQLSAAAAGPFRMTVFTSPDPAVLGDIHVAALIFTAEDAIPVLEADVLVTMEPIGSSGQPLVQQAVVGDSENKLLFEAVIAVSQEANYLVTVSVEDAAGQTGSASFEMEISSDGGINWALLIPLILLGLAGIGVILWYITRKNRREDISLEGES